jgi:uncharacterized membrane protein YgcG
MKYLSTLLIICLCCSSAIWSQGYVINNYDVKVELSKDGYFEVNEVITVTFSEDRRGIMRNIPKKIKVDGQSQNIKLSNVDVKNYEHAVITEGNDKVIRIGNKDTYITGTHTYDMSYRISNGYIFADDHTAFQYNLISDWDTSIENLSYAITLPDYVDLSDEDYLMMTGDRGETKKHVSIKRVGNKFIGRSLLPIEPKENVTIAIKLPKSYINRPTPPIPFYKKDKLWFLPLGFLFLFINFFRRSRQQDVNLNSGASIQEEHFPPSEFSPAMVGAYYDNKVNTEDVIALLPYWAEKGYIKIMKGDEELYFQKLIDLGNDAPEYQRLIFDNLFKSDDIIVLSELKEKMYMHLYKAKQLLHNELLGKNLYDPNYMRIFKSFWMIIIGILLLGSAIAIAIAFQYVFTGIGLFILSIATFVMYAKEPKKSDLGIRIHNHLKGFKQFLEKSPKETTQRLLNEHPKYFEHIYPYAIALGIDKTWLTRMQDYDINAPYWYGYHGTHHNQSSPSFNDFSKDFDIPEITSVFTSAPAASSSSGGAGGGFSGGGAGGGFGGGGSSW